MDYNEALYQARVNNRRLDSAIKQIAFIEEARVTYNNTELVKYMNLLYSRAMYHYLRGLFHASPGLWAILVAIWGVVVFVYNAIVWFVELIKLKELLAIADILMIVWPKFRVKMNEIYGKVSEFSQSIGWGADGLLHLLNATKSGINVLGGMLGKSKEWSEIFGAERAVNALTVISEHAYRIAADPGQLLDWVFRMSQTEVQTEFRSKWSETIEWLEDTTGKAVAAIQQIDNVTDNLISLIGNMPNIVQQNIPSFIPDALNWLNNQIDNNLLPALTNINEQLTQINDELQAERDKAQALANQLLMPGNVLGNIDLLDSVAKFEQEIKIDDITSRLYEKETDIIYESDIPVIEGLESIQKLAALVIPDPTFITLETTGRPGILWDKVELVKGWFVGDF